MRCASAGEGLPNRDEVGKKMESLVTLRDVVPEVESISIVRLGFEFKNDQVGQKSQSMEAGDCGLLPTPEPIDLPMMDQ